MDDSERNADQGHIIGVESYLPTPRAASKGGPLKPPDNRAEGSMAEGAPIRVTFGVAWT